MSFDLPKEKQIPSNYSNPNENIG